MIIPIDTGNIEAKVYATTGSLHERVYWLNVVIPELEIRLTGFTVRESKYYEELWVLPPQVTKGKRSYKHIEWLSSDAPLWTIIQQLCRDAVEKHLLDEVDGATRPEK